MRARCVHLAAAVPHWHSFALPYPADFYFFLTSLGYKPKWNLIVTVLQISQMVVGVAVCIAVGLRKQRVRAPFRADFAPRPRALAHAPPPPSSLRPSSCAQGEACDVSDSNFVAALVMYGSYLFLFVYFAVEKYCAPKAKGGKGKRSAKERAE